jgi:protein AroM
MRQKIAFVTIGQSPRRDMVDEMVEIISRFHYGASLSIVQYGALDNLSKAEIEGLQPGGSDEILVTRLASGEAVRVSERKLVPHVQKAVERAAQGGSLVVVLCTGSFSQLYSQGSIIFPDQVFLSYCLSVLSKGTLGIIVPDPSQIEQRLLLWKETAAAKAGEITFEIRAASPYKESSVAVEAAAADLGACDLIALDCMGYTLEAKNIARQTSGRPCVLARSVTAMAVAELL